MTKFEKSTESVNRLLRQGRLDRRSFIQLAIASGLSAAAAEGLFASAARSEPKRGGSFKAGIGDGSTTDTLDPGTWNNGFTFNFGQAYFGATLVEIDPKNEVRPNLAESIEPANGAAK
jgi:peptide/nickel transport system substrate-binding protein